MWVMLLGGLCQGGKVLHFTAGLFLCFVWLLRIFTVQQAALHPACMTSRALSPQQQQHQDSYQQHLAAALLLQL